MNSTKMSPSGRSMLVAQYTMDKTLAVKPREQIMILADTEADSDLVHAFASVANLMGTEPTILIMPPLLEMEGNPTRVALKALKAADIYIPRS